MAGAVKLAGGHRTIIDVARLSRGRPRPRRCHDSWYLYVCDPSRSRLLNPFSSPLEAAASPQVSRLMRPRPPS